MMEYLNINKTKTGWNINKYKIKNKTNINKIIEQGYFFYFYFLKGEPTFIYYFGETERRSRNNIYNQVNFYLYYQR